MNKKIKLMEVISQIQNLEIRTNAASDQYHYLKVLDHTNKYEAEYFICFPKIVGEDINALLDYVKERLDEKLHLVTDEIVTGILLLFSLSKKESRTGKLVELFFSRLQDIQLKQYMFFNGVAKDFIPQIKFFDYTIGKLDYVKFKKFVSLHTNSDYPQLYPRAENECTGIEVKIRNVKAIDIFQWLEDCSINPLVLSDEIQNQINIYFDSLSANFLEIFRNDFYKQQSFLSAYFGLIYSIEQIEFIGISFINIFYGFLGNQENGWLHPANRKMTGTSFPDPRLTEPAGKFIEKNAALLGCQTGPFARSLSIFCDILSRGEKNIMNCQFNNAFIDFFIGLDFLLAPDTQKSKKLKSRISILVHQAFGRSLQDQVLILNDLYDMRSDYVHNGVDVSLESLYELRDITKVMVGTLFNLHKQFHNKNNYSYQDWIALNDVVYERFFGKGVNPNVLEQKRLGIHKFEGLILTSDIIDMLTNNNELTI